MKITIIGSGSKGNSTIVETNNRTIMIDAGFNINIIEERINHKLLKIDILIITHIHSDHTKGLKEIIKKYNPEVFTLAPIEEIIETPKIIKQDTYYFENTKITLFPLSHDTPCTGIEINNNKESLIYITDTGYINKKILQKIQNKTTYIFESNHDIELLRNGKYPAYLKQRIMSDNGHLSNIKAASYLKKIIGENTKTIVLAHLSEENNTQELAYNETYKYIENTKINLLIAKQDQSLIVESIEIK